MKFKIKLSLCLVAILAASSSFAQSNYKLEKVSVSENENPRTLSQNEAFSAPETSKLAIDKLSEEEIKIANPKNVFEAINQTAGANVQFQGRKNSAIITFRGSSNIYSAAAFGVILDGALLSPMSSLRILESLSVDVVESIEVIRDASALTLGPIAGFGTPNGAPTLGFIVIKTKLPQDNGGVAKFSYESFDTKKVDLSYGGIHDKIFYLASVNGLSTNGKKDYNTAEDRGSIFLRSGYVGDDFTATISAYYSNSEKETQRATNDMSMVGASRWKYEPIENEFISAIFEKDFGANNRTTLQLSHSKTLWSQDYDRANPSQAPGLYFKGTQSTDSIDLRHAIKLDNTIVKVGAQAMYYDAPKGELFYEGYQRKEQIYGAFLHASHAFMDNKLIVDESLRVDKKHTDSSVERYDPNSVLADNVTKLNNQKLSIIEDKWAKASMAFSFGALYKFSDSLEASARFAYLTSGTTDDAMSADGSAMKDEKNYRYELGVKKVVNQYFNPTLNLFLYDNKNIKSPLYFGTNNDPYIVFNQIDQKRYGGELGFDGKTDSFYYSFSYAHATADAKKNEIPKHNISALMQKKIGNYALNFSGKYLSTYESNFFTIDKKYHDVGDFISINISLDYNHKLFQNDAKLSLYSRNLLDENYMTIFGFEDQGRVIGTSYEFKF
jgi:iron complex outermembrane receptor protein